MEYIAIAVNKENAKSVFSKLTSSTVVHELTLISEELPDDDEIKSGLLSFLNTESLEAVKVITINKRTGSSAEISQELINYYLQKTHQSRFINFITSNSAILPEKFFILFAFAWNNDDLCRYKKIKLKDLPNYFLQNNSWYLWLYDYINGFEKPDLDVPLIIEIDNKASKG